MYRKINLKEARHGRRRCGTAVAALWFCFAAAAQASADRFVAAHFSHAEIERLHQGRMVDRALPGTTEREFAMSLAVLLPAAPGRILDYLRGAALFAVDGDVTVYGAIPAHAGIGHFQGIRLQEERLDEARHLLNEDDRDDFNLSASEQAAFLALGHTLAGANDAAVLEGVTAQYRTLLLQRWQAYRSRGLDGIADYWRSDGPVNPGRELKGAVENCRMLDGVFPGALDAWERYPAAVPVGADEYFYWLNRAVEQRPTALLSHSILQSGEAGALILGRQFYVEHSYNSSQMCVAVLPYRSGTLVYYVESLSTDRVSGFAAGLKHAFAREQLKEAMAKHLAGMAMHFRSSAGLD